MEAKNEEEIRLIASQWGKNTRILRGGWTGGGKKLRSSFGKKGCVVESRYDKVERGKKTKENGKQAKGKEEAKVIIPYSYEADVNQEPCWKYLPRGL